MDYAKLASKDTILKTSAALKERNVEAIIVDTGKEALEKIKKLIPQNAAVNNGSSTTLQEIVMIDYLKNKNNGWNNMHAAVLAEKDPAKQAELRQRSSFADYYLGSVHAMTESGEMFIASASGIQ